MCASKSNSDLAEVEEKSYTFAELNERAKGKIRGKHRCVNIENFDWWDTTLDDAVQVFGLLGFSVEAGEIFFDEQSVWFSGWFRLVPDALAAVKNDRPEDKELHGIVSELLGGLAPYALANIEVPKCQISHHRRGAMYATLEDFYEAPEHFPEIEVVVREAAESLACWLRKRLSEEEDYLTSDEAIDPVIIDYDDRYTEDGDTI